MWLQLVVAAIDNTGALRDPRTVWAEWHIWDMVVTAHGDIVGLEPSTWGSIKKGS
jgi:hypothetical protein